jgi:hypothetical protein
MSKKKFELPNTLEELINLKSIIEKEIEDKFSSNIDEELKILRSDLNKIYDILHKPVTKITIPLKLKVYVDWNGAGKPCYVCIDDNALDLILINIKSNPRNIEKWSPEFYETWKEAKTIIDNFNEKVKLFAKKLGISEKEINIKLSGCLD